MRYPRSPFCKWVLPVRLAGSITILSGFLYLLAALDFIGIAVVLLGSFTWQAGTFLEERSPSFRLLQKLSVGQLMRSRPIAVGSTWTIAKVRATFNVSDDESFYLTMQDGYPSGIVLPDYICSVSNDEARRQTMAVMAHPITFSDAIRQRDTALDAFNLMERLRRDQLPVKDEREQLVGVITRKQIANVMPDGPTLLPSANTQPHGSGLH
jgi:signal-transduction protein with cAMP-binding, CBS, and nucleotidyltransferase domain